MRRFRFPIVKVAIVVHDPVGGGLAAVQPHQAQEGIRRRFFRILAFGFGQVLIHRLADTYSLLNAAIGSSLAALAAG